MFLPGKTYCLWYLGVFMTDNCCAMPSRSIYSWHVRNLYDKAPTKWDGPSSVLISSNSPKQKVFEAEIMMCERLHPICHPYNVHECISLEQLQRSARGEEKEGERVDGRPKEVQRRNFLGRPLGWQPAASRPLVLFLSSSGSQNDVVLGALNSFFLGLALDWRWEDRSWKSRWAVTDAVQRLV